MTAPVEPLADRVALEHLHGDEERAIRVHAAVEHVDDAVVADLRRRADFAEEALPGGLVLADVREEDLQRDGLLGHVVADARDHAADRDLSLVGALAQLADLVRRVALERLAEAVEGVAAEVEAERLLLVGEQLGVGPLLDLRQQLLLDRVHVGAAAGVPAEEHRLVAELVLLGLDPDLVGPLEHRVELAALGAHGVEAAGLDQGLERGLGHVLGLDLLAEVEDRAEALALLLLQAPLALRNGLTLSPGVRSRSLEEKYPCKKKEERKERKNTRDEETLEKPLILEPP